MSEGINSKGLRLFKYLSIALVFLSVVEIPDQTSGVAADMHAIALSMSSLITAVLCGDLFLLCTVVVLAFVSLSYLCEPRGKEFGHNRKKGLTARWHNTGTTYQQYRNSERPGRYPSNARSRSRGG